MFYFFVSRENDNPPIKQLLVYGASIRKNKYILKIFTRKKKTYYTKQQKMQQQKIFYRSFYSDILLPKEIKAHQNFVN